MAQAGDEFLTTGERLVTFLESSGFPVARVLNAHELLFRLAARGSFPADLAKLEPLLTPLLCSSPEELIRFHRAFEEFLRQPILRNSTSAGATSAAPQPSGVRERKKQIWLAVAVLTILGLIVSSRQAPTYYARYRLPPLPSLPAPPSVPPDSPIYVPPILNPHRTIVGYLTGEQDRPIRNARIYYLHKSTKSDAGGRFELSFEGLRPFSLLIAHPSYTPKLVPIPPETRIVEQRLALKPGQVDAPLFSTKPFVIESVPPWWATKAARALALALLGALLAFAVYLRSQWLRRRSVSIEPDLRPFQASQPPPPIFPAVAIRRAARQLRRPISMSTAVLAPEPTVRATAALAGCFRPVLADRTTIPEYLVLIDRFSEYDQAADLRSDLFDQLAKQQVRVRKFEFHEDPRHAFSINGELISLDRLASRYSTSALFVFSELEYLRDPAALQKAPWVGLLARWRHAAVLAPFEAYGYTSGEIRQWLPPGVELRSPTLEGLSGLAGTSETADHEYPPLLREFPKVWLEREPPPKREIAQLLVELRRFLGPAGTQCLAACAVYPSLSFDLTRYLASGLIPDETLRGQSLERLTILPWFRYGGIPDWLRLRLIASMTREEEISARRLLASYLSRLQTARASGPSASGSRLERLAYSLPKKGAPGKLEDHTFLSFMLGWKPDRLAVKPPGRLLRNLLAWRPVAIAAVVAIIVGFAGWTVASIFSVPERVNVSTTLADASALVFSQIPQTPSPTEFLNRVLEVAESQLELDESGRQWQTPFVWWCFDQAAMIAAPPTQELPLASTELEMWNQLNSPSARVSDLASVRPGFLFGIRDSGGFHMGIVEAFDHAGHLDTLETQPPLGGNSQLAVRRVRTVTADVETSGIILNTNIAVPAISSAPDPTFEDSVITPDPTEFASAHQDRQLRGEDNVGPVPRSRGGVEPILELSDVLGTKGPAALTEIQSQGEIVFHSVGGTGSAFGPISQSFVADRMTAEFSQPASGPNPSFFLNLGDIVFYFGESQNYYDEFYEPFRNYPAPIIAIAGNHEGAIAKGTGQTSLSAFLRNFCAVGFHLTPDARGHMRTAQIQPGVYFTLEAPFLRIIALYSNALQNPGVISGQNGQFPALDDRQINFLVTALERVKSDHFTGAVIIAVHHPPFTGGSVHGGSSPTMLRDIDAACRKTGVWPNAVLSAHAMNYQRFTRSVDNFQIPYLVAGCGGHTPLSRMGGLYRTPYKIDDTLTLESYDETDYGYLRITVNPKQLRIEFRPAANGAVPKSPDDMVTVELATHRIAAN